ncbi:MAG TPA: hypothetical protein VFU81_18735, partial [Thermomicrobiales bacterium]|nr:hypothetical protein [Thermomicrobiales bacterium]
VNLGGGDSTTLSALCNAGETVVGGGYISDGPGVEPYQNEPDSPNGRFVVAMKNNNGQANKRSITAYAVCMQVSTA